MRLKTFLFFILVGGGLIAFWGRFQLQRQKELRAYQLGIRAYLYAYPLVLLDTTQQIMTAVPAPTTSGEAPVNQFGHVATLPTNQTKFIVRPNVDTLYSVAWLDLTTGPQVLDIPAMPDRYYLIQILDAWTDVIASPGSRTTGTGPQTYVITGPGWQGAIPRGLKQITAPTNLTWIIGRIQTNGARDIPHIRSLQKKLTLTPLSAWPRAQTKNTAVLHNPAKNRPVPVNIVSRLSMEAFFTQFALLLKKNPPHAEDTALIKELATVGIVEGKPFPAHALDPIAMRGLKRGFARAKKLLKTTAPSNQKLINGWAVWPENIGRYGTDYRMRAFIAYRGVGANLPADAIYPTAFVDSDNKPLDGKNCYVIHFDKDMLPPVKAFWSITLYGPDNFLVNNEQGRYALGDRDPLIFNNDGSLDLYVQKASPGKDKEKNWIPAPAGAFSLTARLYWPNESALNNTWHMPPVRKVTCN